MQEHNVTQQERLTAYALNELDSAERAEIEALMLNDAAAQQYVEDVRSTALLLETELKQERLEELARTLGGAKAPPASRPAAIRPLPSRSPTKRFLAYASGVAALLALGLVLFSNQMFPKHADLSMTASPAIVSETSRDFSEVTKATGPEKLRYSNSGKQGYVPSGVLTPIIESAPAAPVNAPKVSVNGGTVQISPEVLKKAAEGDHFESGNLDKTLNGKVIGLEAGNGVSNERASEYEKAVREKDDGTKRDAEKKAIGGKSTYDGSVAVAPSTSAPLAKTVPPVSTFDDMKKTVEEMRKTILDNPTKPEPNEGVKVSKVESQMDSHYGVASNKPKNAGSFLELSGGMVSGPVPDLKQPASAQQRPIRLGGGLVKDLSEVKPNSPAENAPIVAAVRPLDISIDPQKKVELNGSGNASADLTAGVKRTNGSQYSDTQIPSVKRADWNLFPDASKKIPSELNYNVTAPDPKAPDSRDTGIVVHGSWWTDDAQNKTGAPAKDKIYTAGINYHIPAADGPVDAKLQELLAKERKLKTWKEKIEADSVVVADKNDPKLTYEYNRLQLAAADFQKEYEAYLHSLEGLTPKNTSDYRYYTPPVPTPGETYAVYPEAGFESVRTAPLSTFSADVDTASFSNVRRFLTSNQLPPPDAVRVEELINYFKYHYDTIQSNDPFGVNVEAAACPWNAAHRLVRVAIKAQGIAANQRAAGNFVFLIDVSGSMDDPKRLPLVKEGLKALVRKLGANDRVAIVTYAGQSGVALQSTPCNDQARIISVIDSLTAAGETNGGAGIQTAYQTAKANFIPGGINRVILATDGDFNVGVTGTDELVKLIEVQSSTGVSLTALGYGMGNYKDAMLQKIADKGHGNYAYIDTADESRKVLIEQMGGTLVTVAKDVKFQVEFNPANALAYRLIGYEKRALAAKDFNNDAKDAGDVGAGHTVTAFYEIVPANGGQAGVDALKYQTQPAAPAPKADGVSAELLTMKIRYKQPSGATSKRLEFSFTDRGASFEQATEEFKFGSAVALFGQILKQSPHVQGSTMRRVIDMADDNRGPDEGGYRKEFIQLARKAGELRRE